MGENEHEGRVVEILAAIHNEIVDTHKDLIDTHNMHLKIGELLSDDNDNTDAILKAIFGKVDEMYDRLDDMHDTLKDMDRTLDRIESNTD